MTTGSFALVGLENLDQPTILMLLDEQREADAIADEMRRKGTPVAVRWLPADDV